MSLIKRIFEWFKNLLKRLFGKKKVTKKISTGIKNARNKRYLKGYGIFIEDAYTEMIPPYIVVTIENKKKIINKINELSKIVDSVSKNEEIKNNLKILTANIESKKISLYQNEKINDCLDQILSDDDIKENIYDKIKTLSNDISNIMADYGKDIEERVISKYKEINYITLTNIIIDDTYRDLMRLEVDYRHHKYNKNYYNRKLQKLIVRIENLQKIRDYEYVRQELSLLQNELYAKSKDKYDLLFNTEVFANLKNTCDDLLTKVNRRIIDIKKTEKKVEETKKEEKKKEEVDKRKIEFQEKLLKRFKDLELARKILLIGQNNNPFTKKSKEALQILNQYYDEFLNGEKFLFYYERNKTKTELVKLYNNLNYMDSILQNHEFVFVDHINFRMDELITAISDKKDVVEELLTKKCHYIREEHEESILVNNKLDLIREQEIQRTMQIANVDGTKTPNHKIDGPVKIKRMESSNQMKKSA